MNNRRQYTYSVFPADLTTLSDTGLITDNFAKSVFDRMVISTIELSTPIIRDFASTAVAHLNSAEPDANKSFTDLKATMISSTKQILVDIGIGNIAVREVVEAFTTIQQLKDYILANNTLVYLASTKSILTDCVVDLYYSKNTGEFLITPDLTLFQLGTLPATKEILTEIFTYSLASLTNIDNGRTSTIFSNSSEFDMLPAIKPSILVNANGLIAEPKFDIKKALKVMQGLNSYALSTEYSLNIGGADVNVLKDTPMHIVTLDIDLLDLFVSNVINTHYVMQVSPYLYSLRPVNKTEVDRISFIVNI